MHMKGRTLQPKAGGPNSQAEVLSIYVGGIGFHEACPTWVQNLHSMMLVYMRILRGPKCKEGYGFGEHASLGILESGLSKHGHI